GRVRRTGVLTVDDFVKVVWVGNIGLLHCFLKTRPSVISVPTVRAASPGSALFSGSIPKVILLIRKALGYLSFRLKGLFMSRLLRRTKAVAKACAS
ncbi:MAG: hypothetical protein Q7V40_03110, partial [Pseudolabrys sp.]|nr:hypothetical protein [Pseudolabrys sp.]